MPAYSYPAGVRIELLPFGEAALRHFAFLERPEGMDVEDAEGFEAIERGVALPHDEEDEIVPHLQEFDTIGQLYRSIQAGSSTSRIGSAASGCSSVRPNAQATAEHFQWEELVAVTDLASAQQAIDTIVEQGEGARGEWRDAHFGRLLGHPRRVPRDEGGGSGLRARPAGRGGQRPAAGDRRRGPADHRSGHDPAMDLLNVVYEVLLQLLSRYFAHTNETPEQLKVLADVSVGLMYAAIKPLGTIVTTLPIGWDSRASPRAPGSSCSTRSTTCCRIARRPGS